MCLRARTGCPRSARAVSCKRWGSSRLGEEPPVVRSVTLGLSILVALAIGVGCQRPIHRKEASRRQDPTGLPVDRSTARHSHPTHRQLVEPTRAKLVADSLISRANQLFSQDSLEAAMRVLHEGKELEPWLDAYTRHRFARRIGDVYYRLCSYERAARQYLEARRLLSAAPQESSNVRLSFGHLAAGLGNIYSESGDLEAALRCHEEALSVYQREGFSQGVRGVRVNVANVLFQLRRPHDALTQYVAAVEEASASGDSSVLSMALNGAALAALALGDTAEASGFAHRALTISDRLGRERGKMFALKSLAELRISQGRAEEARDSATRALDLAIHLGDRSRAVELYHLRAQASSLLGRYGDAYQDLAAAFTVSREALDAARIEAVRQLRVAAELERTEQQMENLRHLSEARAAQNRLLLVAMGAALLTLGAIGWGLRVQVRSTRSAREANRKLSEAYAQVETLSVTDPLTGLANRRKAMECLTAECQRARRTGQPLAVGLLDLDDFKRTNDTEGHEAGDRALKAVASELMAWARSTDCVARWGGDEFLILLPATDHPGLRAALARLNLKPSPTADRSLPTCSIGFAVTWGEEPQEVLRRADRALYAAKGQGKAQVVVFPEDAPQEG